MARFIGVVAGEHAAAGLVEDDKLAGPLRLFPEDPAASDVFQGMPMEAVCDRLRDQIRLAAQDLPVAAVGVAFPGIIRHGVVEDSPNLYQAKGFNLKGALSSRLFPAGVPVHISNDADAMAAGIAAMRHETETLIRLWFLGEGIGFGRYPWTEGAWEGGHSVVTLDPKERFCGCGGAGHLEGIMGHRAMRLRFLDLEPEEVFESAKDGDARCEDFVKLWHRALAAATATSIHLEGPGKFFLSGPNARFVRPAMLNLYLQEMVKMTPLLGSAFEIVPASDELAVVGAAVNARRALDGRAGGAGAGRNS